MSLATRDLRYFVEVVRAGSLTAAAGTLDVTPAALSKALRRLEDELGLALVDRSSHGMTPTSFGTAFRERAQRICDEHDEALRQAGDARAGRAGVLRIGTTIATLDTVVSPAIARLQPLRPGLRASLSIGASDDLLERTRGGLLDGCVVPDYGSPVAGLRRTVLGEDALVAVARAGHPVLRRRRLDLPQLAACAWILPKSPSAARASLDAVFARAGAAPPTAAVEVDYGSSWAWPLVRSTDLLALVPASARSASAGVAVIDLPTLRLPRTIVLCAREPTRWSPLMKEFAEALRMQPSRPTMRTTTR